MEKLKTDKESEEFAIVDIANNPKYKKQKRKKEIEEIEEIESNSTEEEDKDKEITPKKKRNRRIPKGRKPVKIVKEDIKAKLTTEISAHKIERDISAEISTQEIQQETIVKSKTDDPLLKTKAITFMENFQKVEIIDIDPYDENIFMMLSNFIYLIFIGMNLDSLMKNGAIVFRNTKVPTYKFEIECQYFKQVILQSDHYVWYSYTDEKKATVKKITQNDCPKIDIINITELENDFFQLLVDKVRVEVKYGSNTNVSSDILSNLCKDIFDMDLLRQNHVNIDGITNSWSYFGEKGSVFAWHVEDSGICYFIM